MIKPDYKFLVTFQVMNHVRGSVSMDVPVYSAFYVKSLNQAYRLVKQFHRSDKWEPEDLSFQISNIK